jgi:hypothetical protein
MAMYPEWFGELAIGMAQTAERKHRGRDCEARVINAFRSVFRRVRGL